MDSSGSSLMVVLEGEEYCYLYDTPSFPDVLESLLEHRRSPDEAPPGFLHVEQARQIARGLIGRTYQEI